MTALRIIPLLLATLLSCSAPDNKGKSDLPPTTNDSSVNVKNQEPKVENSDTLIIYKKAAVFFSPDTMQIAKRKMEIGEDNFYAGADDYLNYLQTSHDFLDSVKLLILDAKDKKYLKFIRYDKSQSIIKLDTLKELWGVYLFDPREKEKLAAMTTIDEDYKDYFK
ncbi:MAG TPA: hypothetical protein VII28_14225 [Puia sp.]